MENKEEENKELESTAESEENSETEHSEALPPYNEVASPQPKKKRGVSASSVLILLVLMALGAGGYFFYKQQDMHNQKMQNRIADLEAKLNGISSDKEARKALQREFVVFQGDTTESLNKQEKAIRAVSGEIIQLRQAMEQLATEQNVELPEQAEDMHAVAEAIELSEEEINEESESEIHSQKAAKRSKETQKYIDLVESTFEKFVRLVKEGSTKLWDYFSDLIDQYTKA